MYMLHHTGQPRLYQHQAHASHLAHLVCLMHRFGGFCGGIDCFDASALRMSPAEAAATDPQQRVLLELALLALADADSSPKTPTGTPPAVHGAKSAVKRSPAVAKRTCHTPKHLCAWVPATGPGKGVLLTAIYKHLISLCCLALTCAHF